MRIILIHTLSCTRGISNEVEGLCSEPVSWSFYFFGDAACNFRRVRAFVFVLWPRTGSPSP